MVTVLVLVGSGAGAACAARATGARRTKRALVKCIVIDVDCCGLWVLECFDCWKGPKK